MTDNGYMSASELYAALCERIPTSLSCDWDNDGLAVCADGGKRVDKILLALDPDGYAVDYAVNGGYDCLITHHPLIFSGLKAVNESDATAKKVLKLISGGVTAMAFHTRLDAVSGGVNDVLASLLGLEKSEVFGQNGEEIGRIGYLKEPTTAEAFATLVKERLLAPVVTYASCGRPVHRVAVLGGGGAGDVHAAEAAGADTYVTGELKYHQLCDAPYSNMNLLEAGHYYTEYPVLERLKNMLCEIYASCGKPLPQIDILNATQIKTN
ncbi:MAG: Nif3-like dinuclear metal center hexameric protein [Ruminococcaceae bacterium]|nr:Nif3-like dinuclear metal center hexameric protein [Oscillospiraceae bacterium]